jgi:hypothetical protein
LEHKNHDSWSEFGRFNVLISFKNGDAWLPWDTLSVRTGLEHQILLITLAFNCQLGADYGCHFCSIILPALKETSVNTTKRAIHPLANQILAALFWKEGLGRSGSMCSRGMAHAIVALRSLTCLSDVSMSPPKPTSKNTNIRSVTLLFQQWHKRCQKWRIRT